MVNLAGKALRWEPFGHCVGIEKRPIDSLRRSTEHTVKPDGVCGHDYFASRCVVMPNAIAQPRPSIARAVGWSALLGLKRSSVEAPALYEERQSRCFLS